MRAVRQSTQRWLPFVNNSGTTIPPYSAMRVTGTTTLADDTVALTVSKPNNDDGQSICFNGNKTVPVGGNGSCTFDFPCYANCATSPSNAERFDTTNDSFQISENAGGVFSVLASAGSGPNGENIAVIDRLGGGASLTLGKTDAAHAKDASGTVSIYSGTSGSESDTSENLESVWNRMESLPSGAWVLVARVDGGNEIVSWKVPPKIGKTDSTHNKGASGSVSIWTGTAGSESDSGVNETAYNRFANLGATKWVVIDWINGNWYITAGEC